MLVASPYCAAPSRISPTGPALLALSTSCATTLRLFQKTALASATLSKKSSSEYRSWPQLTSTVWPSDAPGAGHAPPARHTRTMPGVYTNALKIQRAAKRRAVALSATKVPTRGVRCCDGHSSA